jgi:hypothetical protein
MQILTLRNSLVLGALLSFVAAGPACDKDEGGENNCARSANADDDFPDFPDDGDSGWPDDGDDGDDGWPDDGDSGDDGDFPDDGDSGDDDAEDEDPDPMGNACMATGDGDDDSDDSGSDDSDDSGSDDSGDDSGSDDSGDDSGSDDSGSSQGGLGDECTSGDDCEGGKCILSNGDSGFCTRQCVKAEDCPEEGWVCNLAPYTACVPDY